VQRDKSSVRIEVISRRKDAGEDGAVVIGRRADEGAVVAALVPVDDDVETLREVGLEVALGIPFDFVGDLVDSNSAEASSDP
jgi:hypothetical protein